MTSKEKLERSEEMKEKDIISFLQKIRTGEINLKNYRKHVEIGPLFYFLQKIGLRIKSLSAEKYGIFVGAVVAVLRDKISEMDPQGRLSGEKLYTLLIKREDLAEAIRTTAISGFSAGKEVRSRTDGLIRWHQSRRERI